MVFMTSIQLAPIDVVSDGALDILVVDEPVRASRMSLVKIAICRHIQGLDVACS